MLFRTALCACMHYYFQVYYGKDDMRSFVGYELKRRAAKGIASMSALAPEAEAAGELDDVSASSSSSPSSSSSSSSSASFTGASTAATNVASEESTCHEKVIAHGADSGNEGRSDSGSSSSGNDSSSSSDSGTSSGTPMSGSVDDNTSSRTSQVQSTSQPPAATELLPGPARSRNNSSGEYDEDDSNIEF